ncbi:TPA: hypothetical protein ACH3X3_002184 [Trebouxia sp. C0006]
MPLAVGNNVQLLCHTLLSFRRDRRHFKPFAGPVAIPRGAARTAENAGSAVLSTSDSRHTTNTRPLQEQLRDQMELHKLQREGIPENTQTQTSKTPSKGASGKTKRDVKTGSKVADRSPPARTKNARRRRYRGDVQSDGRFKAAFANSPNIGSDLAVQESAPAGLERKKQRTLTKQEDIALCSAIKDAAFIEQQRLMVYSDDTAASHQGNGSAAAAEASQSVSIQKEDKYQKLKQWKDAVGAPTFSQLHYRRDRGERAKTMLLHYNKGLVRQFVWRCKHLGTEVAFGELALAGDEALLKAAIKWDPNKGTRFTTYAFQRVNRGIVGYMMEHEDVIKIPVNLKELQNKIKYAQTQLSQKLQRQPTPQEIAKDLRQPFSRVVLCMRKTQRPINMDAQPTDNERDSMVDLLASSIDDDKGATSLNSVMHSQFASDVEGVLELLPHREGEVLALRYGLFTGEPQSLTDVAKVLKMSVEGVRKNELSAFRCVLAVCCIASLRIQSRFV